MEALDGSFLDGPVDPFHLAVGPGVLHLGGSMLDAAIAACPPEDVLHVGGPVDGHEQMELALGRLRFGDVDVETADRVTLHAMENDARPRSLEIPAIYHQSESSHGDGEKQVEKGPPTFFFPSPRLHVNIDRTSIRADPSNRQSVGCFFNTWFDCGSGNPPAGRRCQGSKKAGSFTKRRRGEEEERVEAACLAFPSLRLYVSL
jgi:hypothetical protein